MLVTGDGAIPGGVAVRRCGQIRNAGLVTAVAGGPAIDVVSIDLEPEGRAEGGDVDYLAWFTAQVDGTAVGAQIAQFEMQANIAGAGFVALSAVDIEGTLGTAINHNSVALVGFILGVPRGLLVDADGAVLRVRLTAVGRNQDVFANRGNLVLVELSDRGIAF